MGTRWALAAAGLAVLPPALWYGGLLMTEALFYPLVAAALLGLARMLEVPTLVRQGTFLLILSFAAAVRLAGAPLASRAARRHRLVRLVRALARDPPPARSTARSRRPLRGRPGRALRDRRDRSLRRVRERLRTRLRPRPGRSLRSLWHAAALYLMVLGLPLARDRDAGSRRGDEGRERPPRPRVSRGRHRVRGSSRPPGLHVRRGTPRSCEPPLSHHRSAATPPRALHLDLARKPTSTADRRAGRRELARRARHAASGPLRHRHLRGRRHRSRSVRRAGRTRRYRISPRACSHSGSFSGRSSSHFLAASSLGGRRRRDRAGRALRARARESWIGCRTIERTRAVTGELDWIDRSRASDVLLVDTGEHPSTSIARTIFWNESVRRSVRIDGVPAQALPQPVVTIGRDGTVVDERDAGVSGPHVVVPTTLVPRGEKLVATPPTELAPGYALWRVDEPLQFVSRSAGFSPVGDFRSATVVVYNCGPGALDLLLLGKDGLPVRITVNGLPWLTVQPEPGGRWTGSVPSLRSSAGNDPCLFSSRAKASSARREPNGCPRVEALTPFRKLVLEVRQRLDRVAGVVDLRLRHEAP